MTLLLKKDIKPKLYKTPRIKHTSNQSTHRRNYLTEFLKEQKTFNKQLLDSFEQVNLDLKNSNSKQSSQLAKVLTKLANQDELHQQSLESIKSQEKPLHNMVAKLNQVDKNSEGLVKKIEMDGFINQAIMDELKSQNQTNHRMIRKLDDYETTYQDLIVQEKKQYDLFGELSERIKIQEAFHETIMNDLSHQKEVTQKITKQLDHFKAFVFEKIVPFIEKIDGIVSRSEVFQRIFINNEKKEMKDYVTKD
jgi:hypothetical protein